MIISIDKVKPGMVVAENIYQKEEENLPMVYANREITEYQIGKVKQKGIQYIKIKFKKDVEETVNDEIQELAMQSVKNFDIQGIIENAQKIVTAVKSTKYLSYDLSKYALQESDSYQHAMDVTCFAVALGKVYNKKASFKNEIDLDELATASLLHEIGLLCRDPQTLQNVKETMKETSFFNTDNFPGFYDECFDEYNPNMLPVYSFSVLTEATRINPTIKLAILLQSEDELSNGPLKVNKKFFSSNSAGVIMAKIIHICDMYEMLISKVIKNHIIPSNIIEIMNYMKNNGKLDLDLTNWFMSNVPLYPIGATIELSNGQIAKVIDINDELLDRPKIKLLSDNKIIDLSKERTLIIKSICEYDIDNYNKKNEDQFNRKF
ncbi:MAG: hypothetical protein PHN42_02100 [Bacilli bacterium]|nr:hypothetical protein [Bacilli bacterium]